MYAKFFMMNGTRLATNTKGLKLMLDQNSSQEGMPPYLHVLLSSLLKYQELFLQNEKATFAGWFSRLLSKGAS
jgi:hypothetical protein